VGWGAFFLAVSSVHNHDKITTEILWATLNDLLVHNILKEIQPEIYSPAPISHPFKFFNCPKEKHMQYYSTKYKWFLSYINSSRFSIEVFILKLKHSLSIVPILPIISPKTVNRCDAPSHHMVISHRTKRHTIISWNVTLTLKKYTHVYLRTRDRTAGVKSIFCALAGCVKGNVPVSLLPKHKTLVPLPFALTLDLIILIRPWPNRGELSSDLPG